MPLGPQHTSSVGFVLSGDHPMGTCFVIRRRDRRAPTGEPPRDEYWMVTARHVVERDGIRRPDLSVRFRDIRSDYLATAIDEWDESRWCDSEDKAIDLVVAPFRGSKMFEIGSISLDTQGWDESGDEPILGLPVYYVGLFTPEDRMGADGVPMVRSGTIGAVCQEIKPDKAPGPFLAHLIDCRSYVGFSGSPVFVQEGYSSYDAAFGQPGDHVDKIGTNHYATWLMGMLISYYDNDDAVTKADLAAATGVAIVVPIDRIRELLDSPDCEAQRVLDRAYDRAQRAKEEGREYAVEAGVDSTERDNFTDLLGKLAQVPKSEVDELRRKSREQEG